MSRIGKRPVPVPSGVKVSLSEREIAVEGPKGKLSFTHRPEVHVVWNEDERAVVCGVGEGMEQNRIARALWGTTRAVVANMVHGVSQGYTKKLVIVGVGWNAAVNGQTLELNLGYAKAVKLAIPQGLTVTAVKQAITIEGADKHMVGQFAAIVRSKRKPEPYKGKGIRYSDEVVKRKQGKQFGS